MGWTYIASCQLLWFFLSYLVYWTIYPRFSLNPLGLLYKMFLKDIISWHCCRLGFCANVLTEVSSEGVQIIIIDDLLGHILELLFHSFLVCFEYSKCRNHHSIYMWLCKQRIIFNIHLLIHTYHLLLYFICSFVLYWQSIYMISLFGVYLPNPLV